MAERPATPSPAEEQLPARLEPTARKLVDMLRAEALNFLTIERLPDIRLETARFTIVIDPANARPGYDGVWRNALNERVGRVTFNSDGSYYAEYDLCIRHPTRPNLFVEAVTAWGREDRIKAEARLIAMP